MTQELSSLMDGELDGHEAERTIRSCCGNEELKQKWQAYQQFEADQAAQEATPGTATPPGGGSPAR